MELYRVICHTKGCAPKTRFEIEGKDNSEKLGNGLFGLFGLTSECPSYSQTQVIGSDYIHISNILTSRIMLCTKKSTDLYYVLLQNFGYENILS